MKRCLYLTFALCAVISGTLKAKIVTRSVEYQHGPKKLVGYLAYDDVIEQQQPGVLVVHEWWGLNDYTKSRTRQLAELGYIAFAVDMYGDGITADHPKKAGELAGSVRRQKSLMRDRINVGLQVLLRQDHVDPNRIAAIGFCFGGTVALELAYSGAPVAGVVTFHGGLTSPDEQELENINAAILILHGAADTHIKPEEIKGMQNALDKGEVDWHMVYYGGTVHSFTNPAAGSDPSTGSAYDPKAAKRAWQHMRMFFTEILAEN